MTEQNFPIMVCSRARFYP